MNIPHKQSDSTNFTDGVSTLVDILPLFFFSLSLSLLPPLLIFQLFFYCLTESVKLISSKQKFDVKKHAQESVKIFDSFFY